MKGRRLAVNASRVLLGEEWTRELRQRIRILRTYHRLKPHRVRMHGSTNWLWVDPDDKRGWGLIAGLGRGHQPALRALWNRAIDCLKPDTVLDVGLNYGEFLLAETYPAEARLFGIEANPQLRPLLERSRRSHPNGAQMEFVFALASDSPAGDACFHINRTWSGASSATMPGESHDAYERALVPVTTVDNVLCETPAGAVLLFKVDVEGWESHVLSGMQQTLDEYPVAVGLMEFDERLLIAAGVEPNAFAASLAQRFMLYAISSDGALTPATQDTVGDTGALIDRLRRVNSRDGKAVTDLLMVSDDALTVRLLDDLNIRK